VSPPVVGREWCRRGILVGAKPQQASRMGSPAAGGEGGSKVASSKPGLPLTVLVSSAERLIWVNPA